MFYKTFVPFLKPYVPFSDIRLSCIVAPSQGVLHRVSLCLDLKFISVVITTLLGSFSETNGQSFLLLWVEVVSKPNPFRFGRIKTL